MSSSGGPSRRRAAAAEDLRIERGDVLDHAHRDVGLRIVARSSASARGMMLAAALGRQPRAGAEALDAGRRRDLGLGRAQLGEDNLRPWRRNSGGGVSVTPRA